MDDSSATNAVLDLPTLQRFSEKAVELAEDVVGDHIHFDVDNDHFGFMASCFVAEQIDYLRAVIDLVQRGSGKAAGIVARSMVEGLSLLKWAQLDSERPLKWRQYAWVADLRTMNQERSIGRPVDAQFEARVQQELQSHGEQFLTSGARKKQGRGQSLPADPYVRSWYAPTNLASICDQIPNAKRLYDSIYRQESERTHWSVASLGKNVERTDDGIVYKRDPTPEEQATFLAVGFQALITTLSDVNYHFNLGRGESIQDLTNKYARALASSSTD